MKKVISLFLSLTMLLSIVSVVDFSAYADVQTGKLGDNVTYSLDTETGLLTISGTGDMYDYKLSFHDYNGREYYSSTPLKMENIKNIIIESGVTDIGDAVFFNCKIQSITIPDTVTRIGNYAFIGFKKSEITLPNSVISIAYSAFNISVEGNISYLKKINYNGTVTQWNSVVYSNKDHHIIKCTDGIIGNGNTVTIDNLKYKINNDYTAQIVRRTDTLGNLIIPEPVWYEGHTFTVTSIVNNAFSGCSSLTSVTIPNSVESIGDNAFMYCSSLSKIRIPDSVEKVGQFLFLGAGKPYEESQDSAMKIFGGKIAEELAKDNQRAEYGGEEMQEISIQYWLEKKENETKEEVIGQKYFDKNDTGFEKVFFKAPSSGEKQSGKIVWMDIFLGVCMVGLIGISVCLKD